MSKEEIVERLIVERLIIEILIVKRLVAIELLKYWLSLMSILEHKLTICMSK
jgi:hypothetical protein